MADINLNHSSVFSALGIYELTGLQAPDYLHTLSSPLPSRGMIYLRQRYGMAKNRTAGGFELPSKKVIKESQQAGASSNKAPTLKTVSPFHISIIDVDFVEGGPGKTYKAITIPTVPLSLDYKSDSTFAVLQSQGRNNPFYHYTGSEDTLEFTLDFYTRTSQDSVVYWCRFLESLTKSDGYTDNPHRVLLQWGPDNTMFEGQYWYVVSANYKLSLFDNIRGLAPKQAHQEVKLKRVIDHNRTTEEIMGNYLIPVKPQSNV